MTEKPKRKAKNRPQRSYKFDFLLSLGVFLAVAFSCLFFFVFWVSSIFSDAPLSSHEAKFAIEDRIGLELPESSEDIFFYIQFGQDDWIPAARVRFTAKADDIQLWLQNPDFCFKNPLPHKRVFFPSDKDYSDFRDPNWWTPYAMETLIGDTCYDGNHTFPYASHLIQIDTSDSAYWTVYFEFWFY